MMIRGANNSLWIAGPGNFQHLGWPMDTLQFVFFTLLRIYVHCLIRSHFSTSFIISAFNFSMSNDVSIYCNYLGVVQNNMLGRKRSFISYLLDRDSTASVENCSDQQWIEIQRQVLKIVGTSNL